MSALAMAAAPVSLLPSTAGAMVAGLQASAWARPSQRLLWLPVAVALAQVPPRAARLGSPEVDEVIMGMVSVAKAEVKLLAV
jgi:hypothetical protein